MHHNSRFGRRLSHADVEAEFGKMQCQCDSRSLDQPHPVRELRLVPVGQAEHRHHRKATHWLWWIVGSLVVALVAILVTMVVLFCIPKPVPGPSTTTIAPQTTGTGRMDVIVIKPTLPPTTPCPRPTASTSSTPATPATPATPPTGAMRANLPASPAAPTVIPSFHLRTVRSST